MFLAGLQSFGRVHADGRSNEASGASSFRLESILKGGFGCSRFNPFDSRQRGGHLANIVRFRQTRHSRLLGHRGLKQASTRSVRRTRRGEFRTYAQEPRASFVLLSELGHSKDRIRTRGVKYGQHRYFEQVDMALNPGYPHNGYRDRVTGLRERWNRRVTSRPS